MSLFELILGTYEQFTLGYKYTPETTSLTQSFASHSHSASIRCLAQCGSYIATGGADDRIVIYNLKTRKEQTTLTHHNDTVNSVRFNDECTHLFSAGQDGIFAIVRIGNWQVEKMWEKAHNGFGVLDIAVHKTGKLALTLGLDHTLRTWNLIKGRQAYIINLITKCLDVRGLNDVVFSPDGVRFALSGGRATEVWSIESGGHLGIIDHGSNKVSCCTWVDKDTLLAGLEDGTISRISIDDDDTPQLTSSHKAHDSRVKCLSIVNEEGACHRIASAASSGEIKIWTDDLDNCLSRATADCRLTCLVVANVTSYVKKELVEAEGSSSVRLIRNVQETKPAKRKGVVIVEMDEEMNAANKRKKHREADGVKENEFGKGKKEKKWNESFAPAKKNEESLPEKKNGKGRQQNQKVPVIQVKESERIERMGKKIKNKQKVTKNIKMPGKTLGKVSEMSKTIKKKKIKKKRE